jgi:hypothetical protein
LECLHHHTFLNMIFDRISKAHCVQILSCSSLGAGAKLTIQTSLPNLSIIFLVFFIAYQTWLGLPHPSIISIPQCMCTHCINPVGIHFLHCVPGKERTWTHDAIHDTFITIAWNVGFHMGWKQLHAFPSTIVNFTCRRVNIVLTKDDIHTLVDIIIVSLMWAYLLPWFCATQELDAFNVASAKERSYHDWHPINQFFPLAIEVLGYLHKQANVFLHDCANAIWSLNGLNSLHLFILFIFFHKTISITLQRTQTTSILSWVVTVGLIISQLPPFQNTPPITTAKLL